MNNAITLKQKLFLIISADSFKRKLAIDKVIAHLVKDKNDYASCVEVFYGNQIDIEEFKQELSNPSLKGIKIIIIKNAQALKKEIKEYIFQNLDKLIEANYFAFEVDIDPQIISQDKKFNQDALFSFLLNKATVGKFSGVIKQEFTVEDFSRSVYRGNYAKACYIADVLLQDKTKERQLGPVLLGVLVSQAPYIKDKSKREKYLSWLFATDRLIKERGITSRLSLQALLCRLEDL